MAKVLVIYYSKTGNTEKMAELVAEGCRQVAGVEVEMMKLPDLCLDTVEAADGYAIGSPDYFSYVAGHVKTFFDESLAHKGKIAGKPCVLFGSHGGGAKVLGSLERLSGALGLKQAAEGIMSAGAPGPGEADGIRALGKALGQAVKG